MTQVIPTIRIPTLTRTVLALASAATLLAGCAGVRHEPLPAVPVPAQWTGAPVASATAAAAPAAPVGTIAPDFWRAFGDPVLDRLIADALAVNNDLAAAGIRAYRAQLQAGLADTNLTPGVTVQGKGSVSRRLDNHFVTRTSGLTATANYELDLWGKLAAQRDSARWEFEATEADREAARLAVISQTAQYYWQIGYFNQVIAYAESNIAYSERVLALVRSRHAAGAVSSLDVAQAEQALSDQRATLTTLLQQRTENRNALAILFDRPPQQAAAEPSALPTRALPAVPEGLPAELLSRRPDLRAAELRLREMLANVDVARTSFYPTFTLTGTLGTSSSSLERVLANPFGTLGLGLALPFIEWNTMQLQIKVSQTQFDEAAVTFRKSLFTALSEVENALSAREQLAREGEQRALSLAQAQRAEALLRSRYLAGAIDIQPWLDQQKSLRDAQAADAQVRLNRLNNRMALYKALGGSDNTSEVVPPA
ncbi:Type I secretion outer membrane protein [Pandoraea communis]|uniref:Type I secretion outer membrane protein n=1 Tax=Pandoraea communis TaxID=2508297 RepID=A0A5E4Z5J9_9BURK|nr:efflux transporter outer membrane subunit [Pandoraea communis]MDM8358148.1 efflux transporter outer membrane subunit [Pandoraea communis]VVE56012.1 Type I secretion outer membrane protein [Pandoraea communis]